MLGQKPRGKRVVVVHKQDRSKRAPGPYDSPHDTTRAPDPYEDQEYDPNYSLVPHEASYPIKRLFDPKDIVAVLAHSRHLQRDPVLARLREFENSKRISMDAISKYLKEGRSARHAEEVETATRQATAEMVRLHNAVIQAQKEGADACLPLPRSDLLHNQGEPRTQWMSIKYRLHSLSSNDKNTLGSPVQGVVAWTCVLPWNLAQDVVRLTNPEDKKVLWKNIYMALHESCPHDKNVARLRHVLKRAIQDKFHHGLVQQSVLGAGIVEQPQSGVEPAFHWTATDSLHQKHMLILGPRQVTVCADHHVPRVNMLLNKTITEIGKAVAKQRAGNIFSVNVRIDAPLRDLQDEDDPHDTDTEWEGHVLELAPYAGPDTCTATNIMFVQSWDQHAVNGFLPETRIGHNEYGLYRLAQSQNGMASVSKIMARVCIGAHRGTRFNDLDILKEHAEVHRHMWADEHSNLPEMGDDPEHPEAYMARISFEDWDMVLGSYKVERGITTKVYTVVTAINYPPYITHHGLQNPRAMIPTIFRKDDMSSIGPYHVHLVIGDWTYNTYKDERSNWLLYYPFQGHHGTGLPTDINGLDKIEDLFRACRRDISTQFTNDWIPRLGFHGNLLLHTGPHGRDWRSALGQWVSFWRKVVLSSLQHKYEQETGATDEHSETRLINPLLPDFTTLLDHGYWMLSPEIPSEHVQNTWTDLLTIGTKAGHQQAGRLFEWYFNTFLTRHLPEGHEHLHHTTIPQRPPVRRMNKNSPQRYLPSQAGPEGPTDLPEGVYPPGVDPRTRFPIVPHEAARLRVGPRGGSKHTPAPALAAKLLHIERRLAQSEQSANVKHLLERVLTRLDGGSDAP
jgi:hypothetical protein